MHMINIWDQGLWTDAPDAVLSSVCCVRLYKQKALTFVHATDWTTVAFSLILTGLYSFAATEEGVGVADNCQIITAEAH